jgi:hypothetical protein
VCHVQAEQFTDSQARPRQSDDGCAKAAHAYLVHSFHGESESGKSLVLQIHAAEQVMAGKKVLFIDFESDPGTVTGRLRTFGATSEAISKRFTYISPEVDPRRPTERAAWKAMLTRRNSLAVVDGVTDSLGVFGFKSNENDDISAWMRALSKTIATKTGAAVVIIDHVTKDRSARNRFAIGGQAKMSSLTGAAYTVEVTEVLGRSLRGVISLRVCQPWHRLPDRL